MYFTQIKLLDFITRRSKVQLPLSLHFLKAVIDFYLAAFFFRKNIERSSHFLNLQAILDSEYWTAWVSLTKTLRDYIQHQLTLDSLHQPTEVSIKKIV
jgi:hypothetical protein